MKHLRNGHFSNITRMVRPSFLDKDDLIWLKIIIGVLISCRTAFLFVKRSGGSAEDSAEIQASANMLQRSIGSFFWGQPQTP
jgi:hypothetical protein